MVLRPSSRMTGGKTCTRVPSNSASTSLSSTSTMNSVDHVQRNIARICDQSIGPCPIWRVPDHNLPMVGPPGGGKMLLRDEWSGRGRNRCNEGRTRLDSRVRESALEDLERTDQWSVSPTGLRMDRNQGAGLRHELQIRLSSQIPSSSIPGKPFPVSSTRSEKRTSWPVFSRAP